MADTVSHGLCFRALSALLSYPEQDLIDSLDELKEPFSYAHWANLRALFAFLESGELVRLQENYVDTFDRTPSHALHLFEHIHGESRDRGQAMVDLLEEYKRDGFLPEAAELPDYVPLFLEFLSLVASARAQALLDDAIHVLNAIGQRLEKNASPYAAVFKVLCQLATVEPLPLQGAPVRDMEEAMETFGPGADGVEPLMRATTTHTMQFHASQPHAGQRG
jgi:nitrate reductase delta subunit